MISLCVNYSFINLEEINCISGFGVFFPSFDTLEALWTFLLRPWTACWRSCSFMVSADGLLTYCVPACGVEGLYLQPSSQNTRWWSQARPPYAWWAYGKLLIEAQPYQKRSASWEGKELKKWQLVSGVKVTCLQLIKSVQEQRRFGGFLILMTGLLLLDASLKC